MGKWKHGRDLIQINTDDRVFVLTGAGISAESGIPTFRDSNGLWHGVRPEDVATPEAWERDPHMVWEFYSMRRKHAKECKPNPAHVTLAQLEKRLGERLTICTQNVDHLHEAAGSKRVIHMHGELLMSRCERPGCRRPPFFDESAYDAKTGIPKCECGAKIRPHICWFGEMPFQLNGILEALDRCTIFITIGSSGQVEPAASFALFAGRGSTKRRTRKYYIGVEEPENSMFFERCFIGPAGKVLPKIFTVADRSQRARLR